MLPTAYDIIGLALLLCAFALIPAFMAAKRGRQPLLFFVAGLFFVLPGLFLLRAVGDGDKKPSYKTLPAAAALFVIAALALSQLIFGTQVKKSLLATDGDSYALYSSVLLTPTKGFALRSAADQALSENNLGLFSDICAKDETLKKIGFKPALENGEYLYAARFSSGDADAERLEELSREPMLELIDRGEFTAVREFISLLEEGEYKNELSDTADTAILSCAGALLDGDASYSSIATAHDQLVCLSEPSKADELQPLYDKAASVVALELINGGLVDEALDFMDIVENSSDELILLADETARAHIGQDGQPAIAVARQYSGFMGNGDRYSALSALIDETAFYRAMTALSAGDAFSAASYMPLIADKALYSQCSHEIGLTALNLTEQYMGDKSLAGYRAAYAYLGLIHDAEEYDARAESMDRVLYSYLRSCLVTDVLTPDEILEGSALLTDAVMRAEIARCAGMLVAPTSQTGGNI